ncbi:extensin-like, partial [Penaeus japonicus]|uniref:extensin-like n=1 Tax=Penaeus japonicus TaxID=27405 RepID=UPI001C7131BE
MRRYHFTDNRLDIVFHSDGFGSGRGFRIEIRQHMCGYFKPTYPHYPTQRPAYHRPIQRPQKRPPFLWSIKPFQKPIYFNWWRSRPFSRSNYYARQRYTSKPTGSSLHNRPQSTSYGHVSTSFRPPSTSHGPPSTSYGLPSYRPLSTTPSPYFPPSVTPPVTVYPTTPRPTLPTLPTVVPTLPTVTPVLLLRPEGVPTPLAAAQPPNGTRSGPPKGEEDAEEITTEIPNRLPKSDLPVDSLEGSC